MMDIRSRRRFPNWILLLTVCLLAPTAFAGRPNVLLITADDLGLQLGCYGDELAETPNIDRLAQESVQFQTAYVSQASCSPSRSTMFTGLYPHGNGHYGLANANVGFQVHKHLIDALLPNVLNRAGYRTGIIGKLHVNPENALAFNRRFNEGFGSREVRKQVEFAGEFVEQAGDQPWFLMFNLFDPHIEQAVARRRLADGSLRPAFFPDQVEGIPENVLTAEDVPPWPWQQIDTEAQRTKIAGYYNCVHRIDAAIGMLMDVLRDTEQYDDTLILFLGDHGPPFTRGKTSCYEAGLRVPFLVRWPEVSRPHVSEKLVGSVDIYPTILDAVNIELPDALHGRSVRPVLSGLEQAEWRTSLVGEFHFHGARPFFPRRAITDGRYKLIHNLRAGEVTASASVDSDSAYQAAQQLPPEHPARQAMQRLVDPPEWELYDLRQDPVEFDNLADTETMREIQQRLKSQLAQWQEETQDPFTDQKFRQQVMDKYSQ